MSENNMKYTVSEAIRSINNMTRKRFYQMLEDGDLSCHYEKWGNGERRTFEGAELARVFKNDFTPRETTETSTKTNKDISKQLETTETFVENKVLQTKVDSLQEQLSDKNKLIDDLRNDRDHWKDSAKQAQETVNRQTYLLENHQKAAEKPTETQESDLATLDYKNESTRLYELLTAFIVLLAVVTVIVMTREMWIPFVESLLNR